MRRLILPFLCLLLVFPLLLFAGCGSSTGESNRLVVYNWGDYIDLDKLDEFRADHPEIDVIYDTYDSNEAMMAKLDGGAQYDILFPSDYMIEKLIKEDRLLELDHSRIENLSLLNEAYLDMSFDPGNRYSLPYMWGTVGILYNTTMVTEPVDSWDILWDGDYKEKIVMYDSSRDSMMVALKRLGYSVNTTDENQLKEAADTLIAQKKDGLVLNYTTDAAKGMMINGNAAMAVVYSGDAIECMGENEDLAYVVPSEGSNVWVDGVCITKSCKNTDAAYTFLNWLCEEDVAVANTEYIGYSTPNKAALDALSAADPWFLENSAYNPAAEILSRCEVYLDLGEKEQIYSDYWMQVKNTTPD